MTLRRFLISAALGATLGAAVYGCAVGPVTLQSTLYLDQDFAAHGELAEIQHALDAWEGSGMGITFDVIAVPHAELTGFRGENTIVIVRNVGTHDPSCPWQQGGANGVGPDRVAVTWSLGGAAGICIDTSYTDAPDTDHCSANGTSTLTTVTVHELGHAFGLQHVTSGPPAVMFPSCDRDWGGPTCVDLYQLSQVQGVPLPASCLEEPSDAGG